MPVVRNQLYPADGQVGRWVVVELIAASGWWGDGEHETAGAWRVPVTADTDGHGHEVAAWEVDLPAQSSYEADGTYYRVTEPHGTGRHVHTIQVPDVAGPLWVRDLLVEPPPDFVPPTGLDLDDLDDVNTAGAAAGEVLVFDGAAWVPAAGGGGGGGVESVTAANATIVIAGTGINPTVAVGAVPQGQVTGLAGSLAGKANTADLDNVAFSGAYADLSGTPPLVDSPDDIGAAAAGHNHDAAYSTLAHNHDAAYSATGHDHDADYSQLTHDHDADYAAAVHTHADPAPVALVFGANIPTDATLGRQFRVTLTGNPTMTNPTGLVDGQQIVYEFTQDGTGSRTVTWGSVFNFAIPVTLSTTPGARDYVAFRFHGPSGELDCVGVALGL